MFLLRNYLFSAKYKSFSQAEGSEIKVKAKNLSGNKNKLQKGIYLKGTKKNNFPQRSIGTWNGLN